MIVYGSYMNYTGFYVIFYYNYYTIIIIIIIILIIILEVLPNLSKVNVFLDYWRFSEIPATPILSHVKGFPDY